MIGVNPYTTRSESIAAAEANLGRGLWDADALRAIVREYALETLAEETAVLVIDETGFLKQGKASLTKWANWSHFCRGSKPSSIAPGPLQPVLGSSELGLKCLTPSATHKQKLPDLLPDRLM